ncbi:unnamed protein product [Aphanomyces euteiches]|uniref:Carbonic anhydrase n=1 Tax=Aphanomyces euteiches TaxID=100861 RepID=A0A6G0XAI1_9STRA|nr:hypothetical protein Ae201684_006902 [Aphanomyces euteiches]KAH9101260.1 hypothetical protein LEN26_015774 [Aphanomyces euteiches]KAH9102257.1 hypothetical protein AeMF1_021122 [Aphanomyces euteiches]KAH9158081.1 hypothetical protein AeRB84_000117 [Aphanomyces euteiches]KAH9197234.1 hypothetical protein AeNC1_000772 [Aphanomyces euteiches]
MLHRLARCAISPRVPARTLAGLSPGPKGLKDLLQRNKKWADKVASEDPTYFSKLEHQQAPEVFWIGCSDSRVPANQILDLPPGEVFVHRNIANQFVSTDMNALSVLEYAVTVLKVKHIIVCGHYGCGGVNAAMTQKEFGLVDNWLRNIKDLYISNSNILDRVHELKDRQDLLTELNVAKSVYNVCHTRIVQNAWLQGQELYVHGLCYRLKDGVIRDLEICISGEDQVEAIYRKMLEKEFPEN